MYSGFFVSWRSGGVFGELDDAASDTLKFADILTALADDATDLKTSQVSHQNSDSENVS